MAGSKEKQSAEKVYKNIGDAADAVSSPDRIYYVLYHRKARAYILAENESKAREIAEKLPMSEGNWEPDWYIFDFLDMDEPQTDGPITEKEKEECALLVMRMAIEEYAKKHSVPYHEALAKFVHTYVYDALFNYDTGLWEQGPDYILGWFDEAVEKEQAK